MLSRQHYKNLFTRYMPITDYYDTYEPDQVKVFNKTGFMDGIRTDAGKLEMGSGKTYIYSVMTNQCADITYSPDREADLFPALLGKIFYECAYFSSYFILHNHIEQYRKFIVTFLYKIKNCEFVKS